MRADRWRGLLALAALLSMPVMALAIPATVRIPRAREARPFAPPARALFSHMVHQPQRCYQCHPTVFPQAPLPFTHADMDQGRFCGACHDGLKAAAVSTYRCESCHVP